MFTAAACVLFLINFSNVEDKLEQRVRVRVSSSSIPFAVSRKRSAISYLAKPQPITCGLLACVFPRLESVTCT